MKTMQKKNKKVARKLKKYVDQTYRHIREHNGFSIGWADKVPGDFDLRKHFEDRMAAIHMLEDRGWVYAVGSFMPEGKEADEDEIIICLTDPAAVLLAKALFPRYQTHGHDDETYLEFVDRFFAALDSGVQNPTEAGSDGGADSLHGEHPVATDDLHAGGSDESE